MPNLSLTIGAIVDIEYPSRGLILLTSYDNCFIALRDSIKEARLCNPGWVRFDVDSPSAFSGACYEPTNFMVVDYTSLLRSVALMPQSVEVR